MIEPLLFGWQLRPLNANRLHPVAIRRIRLPRPQPPPHKRCEQLIRCLRLRRLPARVSLYLLGQHRYVLRLQVDLHYNNKGY